MIYRTCPYCRANLDAGEECDCRRVETPAEKDTGENSKEQLEAAY